MSARLWLRAPAALQWAALAAAGVLCVLVITTPMDLNRQLLFALGAMAAISMVERWRTAQTTLFMCLLTVVVSTRYIFWRALYTLQFTSPLSALLGLCLFLAELYAWLILCLGFMQTAWPLKRPVVAIAGEQQRWPTVDIFIPTYNESLSLVRNTVFAAMAMDYPKARFRVFLLDDGRRPEFRTFARMAGCGYLTREDNLHAKAGNLNAALKRTAGELVCVFDCDHVPTRAFLQMTVGWFQKDPKLALLQTPHHFYSLDPVQRNLAANEAVPGEGDLFYGSVQCGNDLWNASFFCGSCALIRRTALDDTAGFAGETVTEDAHTALKLQRRGWNTAYINLRLSAGLATERLALHIGQRSRWARGMTQIMRLDNPLFGPGLSLSQRLCYLNAMLHFQFPLPRLIFLLSPLAYLIFGQSVIRASAGLILAYALPHLYLTLRTNERLQGRERRPFWGEIYETLLAFHLVKPTVLTLLNPAKGKFNVTSKGSVVEDNYFDAESLRPHMIAMGALLFALAIGFAKLAFPDVFHVDFNTLLLNAAWTVNSLIILGAAMLVGMEARQARTAVRVDANLSATAYFDDGYVTDGVTDNLSFTGLALTLPSGFPTQGRRITHIGLLVNDAPATFEVETIAIAGATARLQFADMDMNAQRKLAIAMMGRADAWVPDEGAIPAATTVVQSAAQILAALARTVFARGRVKAKTGQPPAGPGGVRFWRNAPSARTGAAAVLVCAMALLASLVGSAHAATSGDAVADGHGVYEKRLSLESLKLADTVRLTGAQAEIGVPFGLRRDEVVTGASLTLNFAYSPSVLPDLSHLVVLLNGEVVRSIPLVRGGADGAVATMPINPALFLAGDNQLNIRLVAHYTRGCEDPLSSTLWANISNTRSAMVLTVQKLPPQRDLSLLPAPLFDRFSGETLALPFVFARPPTAGELEAAASVASWFGSLASYRGVLFKPAINAVPKGNAVVFMTPNHIPDGVVQPIAGPSLAVVSNPRDSFGVLLLVMGRNEQELKLAAAALSAQQSFPIGPLASVDSVKVPVYGLYAAPKWLRTDHPVPLGQIVDPLSLEGRGLPPGPLTARFSLAPDLFYWPQAGGRLRTIYRYPTGPWLDRAQSRLDLSVNGKFLKTLPLKPEGLFGGLFGGGTSGSKISVGDATLPDYALFGQNELSYFFDLHVADKGRCTGQLPSDVKVGIDPTSTLDFSGAQHAARLPNLALFAGSGFPFTRTPDLGETAVVLDAAPSLGAIEAFLELMGRFGDVTGAPTYRVSVVEGLDGASVSGKDLLIIGSPALANRGSLFDGAPVRRDGEGIAARARSWLGAVADYFSTDRKDPPAAVDPAVLNSTSFAGLIGFRNPHSGRSVVALLAARPDLLPGVVAAMQDRKLGIGVQGDLSILSNDGFKSYHLGDRYWTGSLPIWIAVGYGFSLHPLILVFCAVAAAAIASAPLYVFLAVRDRRRVKLATERSRD